MIRYSLTWHGLFIHIAELVRFLRADYIIRMAVRSGYLTGRQGRPVLEECAALLAAQEEAGDRAPGKEGGNEDETKQ